MSVSLKKKSTVFIGVSEFMKNGIMIIPIPGIRSIIKRGTSFVRLELDMPYHGSTSSIHIDNNLNIRNSYLCCPFVFYEHFWITFRRLATSV